MTAVITGVSAKHPAAMRCAAMLKKQGTAVYAAEQAAGAAMKAAVAAALRERGQIDLLICGAGTGMLSPHPLPAAQDALPLYENGLWGASDACAAVLPHMRKAGQGKILLFCTASRKTDPAAQALLAYGNALCAVLQPYGVTAQVLRYQSNAVQAWAAVYQAR